jgi:predicted metalloprotease with PDZ domain
MVKILLAATLCASLLHAQTIEYEISFENAVHHEAQVTLKLTGLSSTMVELRMSRSSPGRYALTEFAKNVYNVRVTDGKKRTLSFTRPNPHQWDVAGHDGTVIVSYTLYGDTPDGTYFGVDATHARVNMPATFMWARGLDDKPISVSFKLPRQTEGGQAKNSNWKVATQLFPTANPETFTAPHLQYFMDSPTEVSNYSLREWKSSSNGREIPIRLALHSWDSDPYLDAYAAMAQSVVEEAKAVYGELPNYDVGYYTFLGDYFPFANGDGMEHRNSTFISSKDSLRTGWSNEIGTLAHEYFHSWNVERIRPKSLEPFNFEEANMSGELWFAEGFTSYYNTILLPRAQIVDIDEFAKSVSGSLSFYVNAPGRKFVSAVEMSQQAPFVDAAVSVDVQNKSNTFVSYYTCGQMIGLGLDLTLRARFPNLALDDLMRAMWKKFGKTEIPYVNEDIRRTLGEITNNQPFADSIFNRFIYGKETFDYETLLARAGLVVRKAKPGKAWAGDFQVQMREGKAIISSSSLIESPLFKAGIDRLDKILTVDSATIASRSDLDEAIAKRKPGDPIQIEFEQRGARKKVSVKLEENPQLELIPYETAKLTVTNAMLAFREGWLGSKSAYKFTSQKYCPTCKRAYAFKLNHCSSDGVKLSIVAQ